MQKTVLSTAEVARLFNVTETTVKRWADDGTLRCQKTPGGHRKFLMKHIAEFASSNNYEPLGTLALGEGDRQAVQIQAAVLERDFPVLADAFVRKALSPDETDLFHYFSYLYQHHIRLWEIYDLVLGPGMREIGERWSRGEIGISHEHRASYEVLDSLAKLQAQVLVRVPTGNSVICAALDDELHEIGLRCASYLFESEGWKVHYLGARTPAEALITAIEEFRPTVVCLSLTNPGTRATMMPALRRVAEAARRRGAKLVLGGGRVGDALGDGLSHDAVHRSARDLVDFIHAFSPAPEDGKKHAQS